MLTELEKLVLEACSDADRNHPVTREQLKDITKQDDRESRRIIGSLRDSGYRVISDKRGYWYAKNDMEYSEWVSRYISYAKTIFQRKRAMDERLTGQEELLLELAKEET